MYRAVKLVFVIAIFARTNKAQGQNGFLHENTDSSSQQQLGSTFDQGQPLGGQPQIPGYSPGQQQGQGSYPSQLQSQGSYPSQLQSQGSFPVNNQGQGSFQYPPQGQGSFPGQIQNPGQFPGQANRSPFQSFDGRNFGQSIRKSMDQIFSELFHPEGPSDPGLPNITLPDLSHISRSCAKDAFFYSMNPMHQVAIENVKAIIFSFNTTAERISASNALRHSGEVNPKVWYYALSGCSLHDPEMQKIHKPSPLEVMPDMFINMETCRKAQPGGLQSNTPQQSGFQGPQGLGYQPPQGSGYQPPHGSGYQPPQGSGYQPPQGSGYQPPQGSGYQPPQGSGYQPPQGSGYQPPQGSGYQGPESSSRYRRQSGQGGRNQGQAQGLQSLFQFNPFNPRGQQPSPQQPRPQPPPPQNGQCVRLDGSVGADNGRENVLWYFREDLQLNSHHWYWHLAYPPNSQNREDRRGELFYYVHASMLARYNADRLSNGLPRATLFPIAQNANIPQGYFAHLADRNSGQVWTDRAANVPFTDIIHQNDPNLGINILVNDQILTATNRLQNAIDQGQISTTNSGTRSLMNMQGIDLLGDLIQSNRYSLNPNFYGLGPAGLHNSGHIVFSSAMDPQYRSRTPPGPMADTATSMRDPIFYNWHSFMNGVFDRHKATLPPYAPTGGDFQLLWPGVQMVSLTVVPANGGNPNQLQTFWNQQQFAFNRGLDFTRDVNSQPINICAQQLDHGAFTYNIVVNKANTVQTTTATVRIFMAPRFDEQGNRFTMLAQRSMFFVMDIFTANLNPGQNTITRNSTSSTVTIPWQETLTEQNTDVNLGTPYCGCGWPHHLLLPKGTQNGMVFDIFVMLTNGDQDRVAQNNPPPNCQVAPPLCGIPNGLYPDSRPMGYPFDRMPYQVNGVMVSNLDAYEAGITNVATAQVTITGPAN